MKKYASIDFEYNGSNEAILNLVCCSIKLEYHNGHVAEFWLLNDDAKKAALKEYLISLNTLGVIFLAHNVTAEARSFISLGLKPTNFRWIDTQQEYKMLLNHNHHFAYGNQMTKDGKRITTSPPRNKYKMSEDELMRSNSSKPSSSLLSCAFKMIGEDLNVERKNTMRDAILTCDDKIIMNNKEEIQEYCSSDVEFLLPIFNKMKEAYRCHIPVGLVRFEEILYRGETSARVAIMESLGYPVDAGQLKRFADNVPLLLKDLCEDINSQFEYFKPFKSNLKNKHGYGVQVKLLKEYVKKSEYAKDWLLTDKKDISLSLKALEKKFSWRHDFPRGNMFAQLMRYKRVVQSLNGFTPSSKGKTIFDDLGSDGRVRAYLNQYGSQSARYQPGSISFIPLKASWSRSMIVPPKGRAICSIDYKSEEALIGGINSGDAGMLEAYESGDVYLDYAKRAGAVPPDGTKEKYKDIRNLFKATYLGISYLMGKDSLAAKLTGDTGKLYTAEDAAKLIMLFYKAYPRYQDYLNEECFFYRERGYLKLKDGWIMFGGNDNHRSISNCPIQGQGSVILRKAIALAQDAGLDVIFPLHDAVYIEYNSGDFKAIDTLAEVMEQAFIDSYPAETKGPELIQLDIDTWSPDYDVACGVMSYGGRTINIKNVYVDPRAVDEYERFKKYM